MSKKSTRERVPRMRGKIKNPKFARYPLNPLTPQSLNPTYLNVPTAFVFVVESNTHTATELATFVLVNVPETDFGFT